MAHILLIHDHEELTATRAEFYRNLGHTVTPCTSGAEGLSAIKRCDDIDVVIVHKDIDDGKKDGVYVDAIVEALRKKEELARLGVVSGEFPFGEPHVLSLGADFYFPTELSAVDPWILEQLDAGLVSPKELELRGREVTTPGHRESYS